MSEVFAWMNTAVVARDAVARAVAAESDPAGGRGGSAGFADGRQLEKGGGQIIRKVVSNDN